MPFTTSHPAAVLPLKQLWPRYFSLTGLAAGAMSPDLLYFLLADTAPHAFSHSWRGLFVFCLPAGIIFSFVFHRLFKYHAITALPWFLEQRFSGLSESRWSVTSVGGWLVLVGSVFVGALSHFLWDSFTHPAGDIARRIALLQQPVLVFGISRPVCRWLQHLSTLWGGLYVIFFLFRSHLVPPPTRSHPLKRPAVKLLFWIGGGVASALGAFAMVSFYSDWYGWGVMKGHGLILAASTAGLASWAGFFYFVCAYTAIERAVRRGMPIMRRGR